MESIQTITQTDGTLGNLILPLKSNAANSTISNPPFRSANREPQFQCATCRDCGFVIIPELGAKPCECRRRKLRERVIAAIPQKFRRHGLPVLADLQPRGDLHPDTKIAAYIHRRQSELLDFAQANPFHSFLLAGDNGVGKSHIGYALYLNAFEQGRKVYAGTVAELISDFKRLELREQLPDGRDFYAPVTAEDLRQPGDKWTLLLDEFDKPRVTAFSGEMIFELLNAAQNFGHQVIALSNKPWTELLEVWGKQDEIFGRSIVKRLNEHAAGIEIFHPQRTVK